MRHFEDRKKSGFTLAEVLITLTIIGVIAAITIPNLVNKWQNYSMAVKFQKTYSVLEHAISKTNLEMGINDTEWIATKNWQTRFLNTLVSHLKVKKTCSGECSISNKILPRKYLNNEIVTKLQSYNFCDYTYVTFVLEDGTAIYPSLSGGDGFTIWTRAQGAEIGSATNVVFLVDVNGYDHLPNKIGRDIYLIGYAPNTQYLYQHAAPASKVRQGFFPIGIGDISDDCVPGGKGLTCAKKIIIDKKLDY